METPVIENAQTTAAIADSPFLQSFGDVLKNAEKEAAIKKAGGTPPAEAAPVDPKPDAAPAPVADKKAGLPEFKKEETKADAAPVDDIEVPAEIKSPKAAEQWKTLKREKIAMEKKAADLEAKLASANPNKVAEYEAKLKAIEADRNDMSERLKLLAIERHPEFSKKYETKTSQVHAQLKAVAGAEGEKLVALLSAPDSTVKAQEIDNIVAGMTPANQSRFGALLVKLEDINSERAAEIEAKKADFENYKEGVLSQNSRNSAESKAKAAQIWDKVSAEARALELFEAKEGDEAWNTEVGQRLQTAQSIFNGESSEEDLAKAALWAAAAPKYREIVYAQNSQITKLQKELAAYKDSEPKVEEAGGKTKTVGDSFMDKVLKGVK